MKTRINGLAVMRNKCTEKVRLRVARREHGRSCWVLILNIHQRK